MELTSTLEKNATKLNPFEIAPLQRNDGESSCNSGDGTDQKVQSLTMLTTMMMMMNFKNLKNIRLPSTP